jgi:hypothetical protein
MRYLPRFAIALIAGIAGISCSRQHDLGIVDPGCTVTPTAVVIDVRDSVSQQAIAVGANGTIQLGATADTLLHLDSLTLFGGTALGTYGVTVQHAGYRIWTRTGVKVTQTGACGSPVPAHLSALLMPVP